VLSNCKTFYIQASSGKASSNLKLERANLEDKWILSRLNTTIKKATEDLEDYALDKALEKIMDFTVNDFSRTYIKMTRDREDTKEILGKVLKEISLLLAPFAPYISEDIYQEFEKTSIHFAKWPKTETKYINKKLESEFQEILEIIEKGLAERDKAQIGLKWPLSKATIKTSAKISKELQKIIIGQLNIKEVEVIPAKETSISLNTKITKELEAEGYAREISRKVQASRRDAGLVKTNKIDLGVIIDDELMNLISKVNPQMMDLIKGRTNSKNFIIGKLNEKDFKEDSYKHKYDDKIKGKEIKILFNKLN